MSTCRCEAYRHPHRPGSGECHGHDLADCPDQIVVVDPHGTGDRWHRWVEHGCKTMKVGGWMPIETAPHDGTVIELLGENGKIDLGEWHEWSVHFDAAANGIADGVTGEFSTEHGEGPHTHWRPLNAAKIS